MLKIVTSPDPILRTESQPFDFLNPQEDPVALEQEMIEMMLASNGIGLAANQVGKTYQVFVMGSKSDPGASRAFFNPVILAVSDNSTEMVEGCLSFPGIYAKIKRPSSITAQWQNAAGEVQQGEFFGLDSKVFLHEFDHLNGITFQDRVSVLKWAFAVKQSKKRK